jgi:hypothetical protein
MPQRRAPQSGAQRRLAAAQRKERARRRRAQVLFGAAGLVVVAVIAVVVIVVVGGHKPGKVLAVHPMAQGGTVDGVACQPTEQVVYHIHQHLAIFVNGTQQTVRAGIGIPGGTPAQGVVPGGTCLYWLHTHDTSGIIHVESPTQKNYTLGQFFDIWGWPLSTSQVGRATGKVTTYVNGKQYSGDPRSITLTPHEVIQLDVGQVVPPRPYRFAPGL